MRKPTKAPEAKAPRGRPPIDDPRRHRHELRLNDAELAAVDKLARRLKTDRSAAIRTAIERAVTQDNS